MVTDGRNIKGHNFLFHGRNILMETGESLSFFVREEYLAAGGLTLGLGVQLSASQKLGLTAKCIAKLWFRAHATYVFMGYILQRVGFAKSRMCPWSTGT